MPVGDDDLRPLPHGDGGCRLTDHASPSHDEHGLPGSQTPVFTAAHQAAQ